MKHNLRREHFPSGSLAQRMQSVSQRTARTGVPTLSSQDAGTELRAVSPDVLLLHPHATERLWVKELDKQN